MLALYMSFIDDESQRRLFEEIYLNYRKQMLLVARSVLGSDTDAEDVVHDVFLKIAKKHMSRISKIKNSIDLRNYLLKATKHTALDHLRKRRHEKAILDAVNENNLKKDAEVSDDELVDKVCYGNISEIDISGIKVTLYEFDDCIVAVWIQDQYAFNLTVYGEYNIELIIRMIEAIRLP